MAVSYTQTGAKLKLVINGNTFGLATGFSYSIDYGRKSLRGIDVPFPQEIVSGQQTVRGTVNCIRLQSTDLENQGIVSIQKIGGYQEGYRPIEGTITRLMTEPYINIVLVDRLTGAEVARFNEALVTSQQWSVTARGLMTGSFDFEARYKGDA